VSFTPVAGMVPDLVITFAGSQQDEAGLTEQAFQFRPDLAH
jgi:hypothetical protein